MTKVVCVADYYLPGYKAGGPVRSIANMCAALTGVVQFSIVTRDRDVGDAETYPGIRPNEWHQNGAAPIYYADPFGVEAVGKALGADDVLYLNSFFSSHGSIAPFWKHRKHGKILIAPRGEFSKGALSIKWPKKRAYLALAKLLGLYRNVHWHASTEREAEDIAREFPGARIHVAADPVALGMTASKPSPKTPGELRLGFISRVSPMKNLDGLLQMLAGVEQKVVLKIYGPTENAPYWERCREIIATMPANIQVEYCGHLPAEKVSATFGEHDLFAFPTRGENFGHVIFEALAAGTPVLVSDRTPWEADASGAVTVVPLEKPDEWRDRIAAAAERSAEDQDALREATVEYARHYTMTSAARADNAAMFLRVGGVSSVTGSNHSGGAALVPAS